MNLNSKTAIVTGAGSGFGAGIARSFAAAGAKVLVADINADAARDIAREIGGVHAAVDVSQNTAMAGLAYTAADQLGEVDIFVNNAGVTHLPTALEDVTEAEFDRIQAVNTKSVFLMAKHLSQR